MFARAAEQAREFVEFVGPRSGEAVVEVAAGSGRIAFDGGLAERFGPQGQLRVTDPSAAQLQVARQRAEALGLDWVRFLQAPVEDLPLASGTVGLVLGSTVLHFTVPAVALRSMARLVRQAGRVALNAILSFRLGDGWAWAMEAVAADVRARGLPFDFVPSQSVMEAAFTGVGLEIDRIEVAQEERGEYPSVDLALGLARQVGLVRLLLQGAAADRVRGLEQAFEGRMRERFGRPGWDWSTRGRWINILAHRPGRGGRRGLGSAAPWPRPAYAWVRTVVLLPRYGPDRPFAPIHPGGSAGRLSLCEASDPGSCRAVGPRPPGRRPPRLASRVGPPGSRPRQVQPRIPWGQRTRRP